MCESPSHTEVNLKPQARKYKLLSTLNNFNQISDMRNKQQSISLSSNGGSSSISISSNGGGASQSASISQSGGGGGGGGFASVSLSGGDQKKVSVSGGGQKKVAIDGQVVHHSGRDNIMICNRVSSKKLYTQLSLAKDFHYEDINQRPRPKKCNRCENYLQRKKLQLCFQKKQNNIPLSLRSRRKWAKRKQKCIRNNCDIERKCWENGQNGHFGQIGNFGHHWPFGHSWPSRQNGHFWQYGHYG